MICTIVGTASAQSLNDYLALRKANKIVKSSPVGSLDNFVGTKVVELKCTIVGYIQSEDLISLSVSYPNNPARDHAVTAKSLPSWINGGPVEVRMLVKATHADVMSEIQYEFIAVAMNSEVTSYEKANAPAVAEPTVKSPAPAKRSTTSSRSKVSSPRGKIVGDPKVISIYASFIKNHNKKLTNDRAYEIAEAVIRWSLTYDIDARLVVAVLITESDFNPKCFSTAGAMGLGQLMTENCKEYGINNPYDTNQNLYGTVRQLREHLDRYPGADMDQKKLALALAAYNAGPGAVRKYGGIPPYRETQNYIKRIFSRYRQLCSGD